MKNPICISTGCIYKLSDDRNDLIAELKKLSPDGIELSFAEPKYLLNFNIDDENLSYLRRLEFNSIHAPSGNIIYGDNEISKKVLQKISKLYKQIKAKNVVFHKDQIENYDLIADNNFISSIENDDWRKPDHSVKGIKSILDKNDRLKFTFDFAHALSVSSSDVSKYLNYFQDKLVEVHISIINKKSEKHDFLHKENGIEVKNSIRLLRKTSAPLVLEAFASSLGEIKFLKKEMEYIRKI